MWAAAGTCAYKDVVEACSATICVVDDRSPVAKTKKLYNQAYPMYGKLYRSLKDDFRTIAAQVGS